MLGQSVLDPHAVEGSIPQLPGLGLLDTITEMLPEKTTRQTDFIFNGKECKGYEIHQGITTYSQGNDRAGQKADLIVSGNNCTGTYLHGFLDNSAVTDHFITPLCKSKAKAGNVSIEEFKNRQYDLLADHVRKYVDIEKLIKIMTL